MRTATRTRVHGAYASPIPIESGPSGSPGYELRFSCIEHNCSTAMPHLQCFIRCRKMYGGPLDLRSYFYTRYLRSETRNRKSYPEVAVSMYLKGGFSCPTSYHTQYESVWISCSDFSAVKTYRGGSIVQRPVRHHGMPGTRECQRGLPSTSNQY